MVMADDNYEWNLKIPKINDRKDATTVFWLLAIFESSTEQIDGDKHPFGALQRKHLLSIFGDWNFFSIQVNL